MSGPRTNRTRRRGFVILVSLFVLLVLLAVGALLAIGIRSDLLAGRRAMDRGRNLLLAGEAEEARASFASARASFGQAADAARNPLLRAAGWIPILGRTPDAVRDLTEASVRVAEAGWGLAGAITDLPDGLGSLSPVKGRVPVEEFPPLTAAVGQAEEEARAAREIIEAAPGSLLLWPVGEARGEAEERVRSAHESLLAGSELMEGLPGFLGESETRRYFFGAENPAELRGTAGIMGAYSILTIRDGRFSFSPFRPVQNLPDFEPDQVTAPSEDYARNYNQFGGAGFWLNINMTPDFPSAAQAIETSYEKATGARLDGVISADPFALEALLKVTGPARVPGLDVTVDADNVVAFTANEAFGQFPSQTERKLALGATAKEVFERFLNLPDPGVGHVKTLAKAAAAGHIKLYSNDEGMQEGFVRAGIAGSFEAPPGDFVSVVQNNGGGNKVDFFTDRTIDYSVRLEDGGEASSTTTVSLANGAPTSGQPKYVIGPFKGFSDAGESVPILSVYCADECQIEGAELDGEPIDLNFGIELGHPFYRGSFGIPSGETAELRASASLGHVWDGNSSGGRYRLTFLNQPTIRPTEVSVEIEVPDGMHVTETSLPMQVVENGARWTGIPGPRMEFEVEFQPSLPLRMWRNVTRFFSQPLIRL